MLMQHTELMEATSTGLAANGPGRSPAWFHWSLRVGVIVALVVIGLAGALLGVAPASAAAGTDKLGPDEWLFVDQSITSADGMLTLLMQSDGNLVLYLIGVGPLWATNTVGSGADRLLMQSDGNLVLYNPSRGPVWASNTVGESSTLILQNDGNLVIYRKSGPVWATNTASPKDPRPTDCEPGSSQAALFVEIDFQRICHNFGTGSYPNITAVNLPDNTISSVRLGSQAVVELCSEANFEGVCEVLFGDDVDLTDNRVGNNRVSSLRVKVLHRLYLPYVVE